MTISSRINKILLGILLAIAFSGQSLADDWQAVKLRGAVFELVDDAWQQLVRGDVVPDERVIRTSPNGRAQFRRDNETIDLGPNTQIRIFDRAGQKFTIVQQHFGDVAIEAERQQVQHFVVQTRFLAALVKGTRFTVTANETGAKVSVQRGVVEVRDTMRKVMVDITPGQSASVGEAKALKVSGRGALPVVVGYDGNALAEEVEASTSDAATPSVSNPGTSSGSDSGTPAVANTANTPAASVVANTPAASKPQPSKTQPSKTQPSKTQPSATSSSSIGTPAVSNTKNTPAASVVANTPAASKSPPGQAKK